MAIFSRRLPRMSSGLVEGPSTSILHGIQLKSSSLLLRWLIISTTTKKSFLVGLSVAHTMALSFIQMIFCVDKGPMKKTIANKI